MIQNDAIISILVTQKILNLSLTLMMQFDRIISKSYHSFMKCKGKNENVMMKRKMQGQKRKMQERHKRLLLGSLRASRAINN
jgi:hypothetical protein